MGAALSLAELRKLPAAELIRRHDQEAESTMVGTNYYLQELARRDAERQTNTMVRLTWAITLATVFVGIFTAILLFRG